MSISSYQCTSLSFNSIHVVAEYGGLKCSNMCACVRHSHLAVCGFCCDLWCLCCTCKSGSNADNAVTFSFICNVVKAKPAYVTCSYCEPVKSFCESLDRKSRSLLFVFLCMRYRVWVLALCHVCHCSVWKVRQHSLWTSLENKNNIQVLSFYCWIYIHVLKPCVVTFWSCAELLLSHRFI